MRASRPRAHASLRASLMGFGVGAVAYVALLGLLVKLAVQPSSARLRESGQSVLQEYRESTLRASTLDATRVELWQLLTVARTQAVPLERLTPIRERVEWLAETSKSMDRLSSSRDASELRFVLAAGFDAEARLRSALLGAVASLELGEVEGADFALRRADSLYTPLSNAVSRATTVALQQMASHEAGLARTLGAMNAVMWVWLVGGALALSLLALFLNRRLHAPLARLDGALDRISAGDLDVRLEPERPDELGRLMQHFNRMTSILRQRAVADEQRAEDRTAARTKLILDASLDAVIVTDVIGTVREWSPQAEHVFGWSRAEMVNRRIADTLVPPEYRDAHNAELDLFARTGAGKFLNRRLELLALRRDGTRFPVEITITPLKTGNQVEFSAFVRDITERKRAQAALSESEARYRAAFEQAGVGMQEVDLQGNYLRVNRAFADFVGRTAEEIVGLNIGDLAHPDDRAADEAAFRRAVANGVMRRQKPYVRPDGSIATANLCAVLVRDSSGGPRYVLTVVQDVTAQRRLEEGLRQAYKMDAVGQLAGGIAHDFNNLLTAIIGYAELLRATVEVSEGVREDASAIVATASRGAELARNLLTLARTAPSRGEPVDVHQAINEVRVIASRTFDRRIALHLELNARRPVVTGDRALLTNAFLNLALNARDAMPDGGQLTVTTTERLLAQDDCDRLAGVIEPGAYIIVRFEDTGTGIPPSIQRRVFEPYFTNKPAGKGTGIGLSMVYGTVRSHSGAIELESTVGAGSAFTLYLPLQLGAVNGKYHAAETILTGSGRILLVDDDDSVRDVATRMLRQLGYVVECASDGVECVDRVTADRDRFDLVILDGNMPRMHGREAALVLRELAPELPLILSTGYFEPGDTDRLSSFGFCASIAKPFTLTDLSRVVAQQLTVTK